MSMRAWAISRIETCRAQEAKFGTAWQHRSKHHHGPPQALVEAWTERRALEAVLREIGLPYEPDDVRASQHRCKE